MDAFLKVGATVLRAAVVQREYHITLLGHVLQKHAAGHETVGDQLGVRAAVNVNQTRVFLCGVHVWRGDETAPKRVALFVEDGEYLGGAQRTVGVRILAVFEFLHRLALVVHHADDARGGYTGEVIHKIGFPFVEDGCVRAVGGCDTCNFAVFQSSLAHILVHRFLGRSHGEIDILLFGIQALYIHDVEAAIDHLADEVAVEVVQIEMTPAIGFADPEEVVVFQENHAVAGLYITAVALLNKHFHFIAGLQIVTDELGVVLLAVEVRNVEVLLIGRESHISEELAVVEVGVDVVVNGLAGLNGLGHIENADLDLVGGAARHGVFYVLHRSDGRGGVHQRIVIHHTFIHAVESDVIALG